MAVKPKRLGEILMDNGVLKKEGLMKALDIQKREGGLIGEILVDRGIVTEEDVVVALAQQLNYPYLAVSNFVVSEEAVRAVPVGVAVECLCIPLDKIGGRLAVAMSDPSNQSAVRTIERASGCRVQTFVSTISEIEAAIEKHYRKSLKPTQLTRLNERLRWVLREASQERQKAPK